MTPQQIEAMKMALEALKWCHGGEPCGTSEAITALEEALAQPEQEPVIDKSAAKRIATTLGWEPKRGWVGAGDLENSNAYLTPPQQEQELVAYAGVKVWVGNQQVVRCLTQTELHYAVEPWLLVELNALKCIASFKEKKT